LDYDTVAGADKFGNVWVLQVPENVNDNIDNPVGARGLWDQGLLNGAPAKAEAVTHYHLGELVTAMSKSALVPGGREAIIAATVMGGIYAFVPFASKDDIEFFQHLEMYMRQESPNLCQRDHLSYRYDIVVFVYFIMVYFLRKVLFLTRSIYCRWRSMRKIQRYAV
jgi:splicing factor 3B subunit 3